MSPKILFPILSIFLSVLASGAVFGSAPGETPSLSLNSPLRRDFQTTERHLYSVSARAGDFIEIVCERFGADTSLSVFSPTGEKISASHPPVGFSGLDRLVFVAEKAGEYHIAIESQRLGKANGNYTILLKTRRQATETDEKTARAMKLSGEARAVLFGAENRLKKAQEAYAKLEKALALFEKADDHHGQANTFFHLAHIAGYEFGDKAKSIEFYKKAHGFWSKTDDEAGRAIGLAFLADEIRDYDGAGQPRSFYTEKAQSYFDEALAIQRKLNNKADEATTLAFLCRLYNDTGSFQKGFDACRESLRLEADADPLTNYRTLTNLASLYGNSGDAESALKYNALALERFEIVRDFVNPFRKAFIKANVGGIHLNRKKYAEAEQNLRQALAITEMVGRKVYSAYILVRLGLIFYETNRLPEALEAAQKAVEYYRQMDPAKIQAALNALGRIQQTLGQEQSARALFSEAVAVNRRNNDRYAEAESSYFLAKLEKQAGNIEGARQAIALAINNSEILRAQFLGRNQRTSYLSILKKYCELEIELLVFQYEKTADPKFLEQAWQTQEKVRARTLLESLIEGGLELSEFAPKDFYARELALLEEIAAAERKRLAAVEAKDARAQKAAGAELVKKLAEHESLQESFRQQNPQFSAINQPRTYTAADAQKLLDDETAILEFALGGRQSYVWVMRRDSFSLVKLPPKALIEKKARDFYLALTDRAAKNDKAATEKSRDLSRAVLAPLAAELVNARRLIVIADGGLQMIPFAALTLAPDAPSSEPLAEEIEIINAPSFASLVFLRENKASRAPRADKLLAIFADPIFQIDDERFALKKTVNPATKNLSENLAQTLRDFGMERLGRLPFSGAEAREIGKYAPQRTFLALGADASRQSFLRGDFNSYRMLHFATHGFLNQQNPELSGLVLSLFDHEGNPQNGFLRVIDLYSLRLESDLVVLSACQTALGKEMDGEGVVGLTRGFMYAGASGVVSSLWKVEDAATAELMKRFYRAMLKEDQTPSAALRDAQNGLRGIARFRHPRHWAGFTLHGEWR